MESDMEPEAQTDNSAKRVECRLDRVDMRRQELSRRYRPKPCRYSDKE